MKFGDNLKKLRKTKNLSQETLAEKMRVSRQSVSKWETGEAYPEMNNILQLCKIFHCSIADLVNDNIVDINSLDEDTKMSVIKLKKEQQVKVRILSKSITTISRIGETLSIISLVVILLFMIIIGLVANRVDVINNQIVYSNTNNFINIIEEKGELSLSIFNMKTAYTTNQDEIIKIKELLTGDSKLLNIGYVEVALLLSTISLIFTYILLKQLEKLFNNIHNGDTPFTLENVGYIKKISYVMVVLTILPNIINVIMKNLLIINVNSNFALFSIVQILFVLSLAYIFQYGYEIQLDSKGKMYEDKSEQ